jgi:predicted PurR-regulated permease PerM
MDMTNMIDKTLPLIDYANTRDDRWLAIGAIVILLVVLIGGGSWLIKYLLANNKQSNEKLAAIAENQVEVNKQVAVSFDRNTEAFEQCTIELRRCRESRDR